MRSWNGVGHLAIRPDGQRLPGLNAVATAIAFGGATTMKRYLAAFAIAASVSAPVAHANDGLEAKLRAYVPVVSLAKVCDFTINDAGLYGS